MSVFGKSKNQKAAESSEDESDEDGGGAEEESEVDDEMNIDEESSEVDEEDIDASGIPSDEGEEEEIAAEEDEENEIDHTIDTNFIDDSIVNDLNRDVDDSEEEEQEQEESSDDETEQSKSNQNSLNSFTKHLKFDLSPKLFESISANPPKIDNKKLVWPCMNNIQVEIPTASAEPPAKKKATLLGDEEVFAEEGKLPKVAKVEQLDIKAQIAKNIKSANKPHIDDETDGITSELQNELLSIMNNYQDLYYPHRTHQNGEQLRMSYCIHALDHVLKARQKVLQNNTKLAKLKASKKNVVVTDDMRDQGFVRPRVLIVLPFRDSAYRVVNMLLDLLCPGERSSAINYKRFQDEFTGETLYFPKKNPKPEDYELTFAGNTEDTFRVGIQLNKRSMKLYTPFYASDILIASPLGLRLIIGAAGEKEREYDFLASIELLILDQMELFLAQNWDHLLHLFEHLHLQPQSRQNTDFSRVRSWNLNGWGKFYRQTVLMSSYDLPEFRSLFNNRCRNYAGKVRTVNIVEAGSIRHVVLEIPQTFHRIEVKSLDSSFDTRFEYFTNTILPKFKPATTAHCMIYVPSYFDYVRLRNYMKKEDVNFTQICEYTKDNKMSRARTLFYHGGAHFLLYSERAHFFRRMRIKGVRHIIMYQPPTWHNFYPEMINLMHESNQNPSDDVATNMSVTVLYTKYDILQLSAIVGHENVAKMLGSKKSTHMFVNNN